MRSLSVRLLLSFFVLITVPALAHDVVLSGTSSFASLDGSSNDHDGAVNGVFTVNDGNLVVSGVVNCNDDTTTDACAMAFSVSGNMSVNAGGALYAENRTGSGTGGAITLTVGGNLALTGNAIVSAASKSTSGSAGGAITANVSGTVVLAAGSTIDSGSANAAGGAITIASGQAVTVDGNVLSGPSRTLLATRLGPGAALDGGNSNNVGGAISISSSTFIEPAILVGATANIVSQGADNGAGPVTIDGCGIQVRGFIAALSKKAGSGSVRIRSGKDVLVDGRDLGAAGTRMGRVRADAPTGTALNKGVDIFAGETIDLFGPAAGSMYLITSLPGIHDSKSYGGVIRITSLEDAVNGSGKLIDDGHSASGDTGGTARIAAKANVTLNTAEIRAHGDFNTNNSNRGGGSIDVRSHSGNIVWTNGVGEVRPVGSTSGLAPADQGTIVLTACGTIDTTGTSFPVEGVATSVFPETHTGVCSPAAPSLPTGVPPLVTCNTPPVANDTSGSTNEDTTVTITLSGTDADGDALTFSIVSGPSNGTLGAIVPTSSTTATVNYTPSLNYNGGDSFVYRANDGNGGTDDATATITIAPVNDPPVFQAGPTVTVLEDAVAQTYPNWATGISGGPADESGQTVTFTVTNSNNALFAVQPAVASDGTLTFAPATNAYGSATITIVAQDNGGTANGGNDTSAPQTSTINVTAVNDEPSFVAGANQSAGEDAGAQSVSGWATAISAGPNEGGQTVSFVVSSDNTALFSTQPAVASNGTLTYTPAANANGVATVSVYAQDNGGTANGGDATSAAQTFTITVNAVNDEPSFTSGGDVTVLEDSVAYSAPWATSISAGPSDENGQSVSFTTSNNNNALFSSQPAVSATGTLTFTVAPNAFGSAMVTVTLSDNGGTANGGDDTSPSQTFTITVDAVNDEPSFTSGGNIAVLEDSGAYSASWVAASSAGPGESQTLTYFTSNDNNGLFSVQPSVAPDGTLNFTPAANANGSAIVTIYVQDNGGTANGGDDTSGTQTFTIEVTAVNDTPSFTGGGNVNVNEDSGAYSATWATAISAGPADESGQTLTFNITGNTNASLFAAPPSIASDGTLSFTLLANAFGTATITVTLSDDGGGANTSAPQSFDIVVGNINDAPTFTPGGDVNANEDSGAYSAPWASSISAGPSESGQTLTFVVSNDNNALFAAQPAISASGVLTFTPSANASGTATVTVYLQDNGGTANGGSDTSGTVTFQIVIAPVNDAPSFTSGGNVSVSEDSGAYSAAWASGISAGPADESAQTVSFVVSVNSNPSLFAVAPSVSSSGVLSFTLAANASGTATITLHAQDNGGTANGGVDVSPSVSFTITVDGVNDAPSFTSGGDVTVNEDSGAYSATWATSISSGPNESGQVVTFFTSNANNALFSTQPSINGAGVLTFTPAPNAFGTATVSVYAQDNGGTANGGTDTSATVTFVITVNGVNEPPVAGNDTWETLGNTELRVDLGAGTTPAVADTTASGKGVLDNDTDAEGDPFVITGVVGCADTVAPYVCAVTGGTVTLNANGTFSFHPSPGATSASFQYTVTDQPPAGIPASANATVNITIHDMIWYVNGAAAAGGNGTSDEPFNNFSSLTGAGDVDGAGAYIFVHTSAVAGSIELETSQRLWGEGVGLIIPRNLNGNGSPATLVAPGVRPTVTAAGDVVLVDSVTGVEIAGLNLTASSGNSIDVTSLPAGPPASASIYSNVILASGGEGVDINAGSPVGTTVSINNTSITAMGNGVDLFATDGAVVFSFTNGSVASPAGDAIVINGTAADSMTVAGLANVTITNTAGDGISITGARFDANPATGAFEVVNTGAIDVGTSVTPVGAAAVKLLNVTGDLAFGSLRAYGASGVTITGSGLFTGTSGMRVTSGGGAISAAAGVGLSVTNTTIGAANLSFTSISAMGAANGIVVNNTDTVGGLKILGTGTAGSGGTIQSTSSHSVLLTSTAHAAFNNLTVQNSGGSGVKGTVVTNFAFTNGSIDNSGTAGGIEESNIAFNINTGGTNNNVSGTVTITGNTLTNASWHGVDIRNFDGTLANVNISGNTLTSSTSSASSKGSAIRVQTLGSATTTAHLTKGSFANNVISNFPSGSGIQVQGGNANIAGPPGNVGIAGSATDIVSIIGNRIKGLSAANRMGTSAILATVSGRGQGNFDISGNGTVGNPLTNVVGTAIGVGANGFANVTATTANNVIVANNGLGSAGIGGGTGITFANSDTPALAWTITGNSISATDGNGILTVARGATGTLKLRIQNNTVAAPLTGVRQGIRVDAGNAASVNDSVCLNISGNASAGSGGATGIGLRKQGTNAAINAFGIQGLSPSPAGSPAVENHVDAQNPAGGGTQLLSASTGFTACSFP